MEYPIRVRIKKGWFNAYHEGKALGPNIHVSSNWWTPVLWDDAEDPDFHKTEGLEGICTGWRPLIP